MSDERLRKSADEARASRAMQDRTITENRELTDQERLDMFRMQYFQSALPDLPKIPGYHVCWLSTTNERDPIPSRLRLGYSLVRAEEIPGWEHASLKTGEYVGCVGVNEMVAAKIPDRIYQMFMHHNHAQAPDQEQGKITEVADRIREQARRKGADVDLGDGFEGLRHMKRAPNEFV